MKATTEVFFTLWTVIFGFENMQIALMSEVKGDIRITTSRCFCLRRKPTSVPRLSDVCFQE
jgi:hypothetical protein